MVAEIFGYGISALTAIGALWFGLKQASNGQLGRLSNIEKRVQILERREVWHERKQGILIDTLKEHGIPTPAMPPAPEAYDS